MKCKIQKLSPFKSNINNTLSLQSPLLKSNINHFHFSPKEKKSNQKLSKTNQKSDKSLQIRPNNEKLILKTLPKQLNSTECIAKQYAKSTFQRYQQKLSIHQKITEIISQIVARQLRLKSYYEIYRLLESEIGQQRCLQHNNDLSLYCGTENRVLCVHCIYGQNKHKTHKVMPLKDSMREIKADILKLRNSIQGDIDTIKIKIKTSEMNEKFIERHFKLQMQQLEKNYIEKLRELQTDFFQKKAYVTDYFEALKDKNISLTSALKQFEKDIALKLSILAKEEQNSRHDYKDVSRQTILTKIAELSDLKGMALQDLNEKDIGQNTLRSRVTKVKK